jgi:hypothetical protein
MDAGKFNRVRRIAIVHQHKKTNFSTRMKKAFQTHLLITLLGLLCLLTACEDPEPPELPKDVLTAIAPQDRAALSYKDFGFHWTASKSGGFRFKILRQGVTVIDTLTNEDHYFPRISLYSPGQYTWELSQADLKITRSFSIATFFAPFVGTYSGMTSYYSSTPQTWTTYADSLTLSETNGVADVVLKNGGTVNDALGSSASMNAAGLINAYWGSLTFHAHLAIDTNDSSMTFLLRRAVNARGDSLTYSFTSN